MPLNRETNLLRSRLDKYSWENNKIPYLSRYALLQKWLIGLVGRMFVNGPGDLDSIPSHVIPKSLKMVLDTSSLNILQCKVHIKGKMEQSWERSSALP